MSNARSPMVKQHPRQPAVCHGHSRPIVELQYSQVTPDGYFLCSASKDGQPMLRQGTTGDWIGTFLGHKGAVWSCVLDQSATLAGTASADFSACVWDALSGLVKHSFPHKHIVRTCAFAPSGNKFATGGMEKFVRVFDLERPDAEPATLPPVAAGVRCMAYLGPDTMITACQDSPDITVWDLRSSSVAATMKTPAHVSSIDVTFDGSVLTTTDGNTIRFWDIATFSPIKEFTVPYAVEAASYCPSKQRFAAGGTDMWVRLHDFTSGGELECCKGHHGPVHTVRFGPSGKEYASGSEDGTIRIWQTDWDAAAAAEAAAAGKA